VVPPSGVKKNQTSIAFAVVVRESAAAPPGNLNEPQAQATVLPGVASFDRISVNEDEPVATGYRKVNVQLPVSVAENTLPLVMSMLIAAPVLPSAVIVSA